MFRLLFFAYVCAFVGAPFVGAPGLLPTALAQTEDQLAQARAAFQRGVEAYSGERFEEALRAFQEAYRIAPHPSVRVNMANCYERLERPIEALGHFERFLVEAENASPEQQREVRTAIRRLRARVGEVFVRVEPEGATVRIGALTRTAPVLEAIELARGTHRVEASLVGYQSSTQEIQVRGGDRVQVTITLEPSPIATPDPIGLPTEEPVAEPLESEPLVEEDDVGPSESRLHFGVPTIAAGAATVALLGTAIGLGVAALGAEKDFDDAVTRSNMGSPAEREAAREDGLDADRRASRLSIATDVIGVTALLAAGATVFFLLWDFDDEDTATTQVAPIAGPNAGGLIVRRSF
jgi:hypothetical protein